MKIANIVCTYPPYKGGMGNSAKQIANILSSEHTVTTFTPLYDQTLKTNDAIQFEPLLKFGNGAILPQLFCKLKNFDYIYLHYPFFGTAEIVWLYKLLNKKPKLIIHYHMDTPGLSWMAKILSFPSRFIRTALLNQAELIISANLDYIENSDIKKFYQKNKNKFKEISFPVDTERFKPGIGQKKDSFSILFVGGLDKAHSFKGVDILLEAFSLSETVKKENSKLLIVGQGDLQTEYEKLAQKLNLKNKVKFLNNISNQDLPGIYQQADILILPSTQKNEAFGIVLLEAMASGLPVIASNLPGVRKTFTDLEQGLLVEPNSINDLKEKIDRLSINQAERTRMSFSALRLIEEKYALPIISKKFLNIFKQ